MPNEDYFYTAGKAPPIIDPKTGKPASSAHVAFRFKPGDIRQFSHLDDAVVVVYQSWEVGHQRIASVDEAKRVVTFRSPLPWAFDYWGGNVRYFVENVPEALDAPGEWYLDRKTGLLSYVPFPGEDLTQATVVAPVAKQLIVLNGKPAENQFVSHLRFENLRLLHTDWEVPPQGHAAGQAACDFPGAIEAVGARNCSVEGCELAHLGTYGVWLRFGCQDNRIARNEIHDLGAGGVRLGEQSDPRSEPETAQRNTVDNNLIHDGGKIDPGAVGVWIGRTSYNRVSHNEICDLYYTGISVGWSWGYAPTSAHHNVVEFNHIHNIGRGVLGDMGGIYCLGDSPGTVLRNNLVHDVYDHHTGSLAIYTDEGSTGILIENNIGYGTTYANFHQHYGKENIVRNNIWALGKDYQLSRARQEEHISFTFERNIVYFDNGKLLKGGWTNDKFVMDRNLYWDTSHPDGDIKFGEATLAEWQARGHDRNSLIADPKFVDAAHFDFRLQPDSPAFKLGLRPDRHQPDRPVRRSGLGPCPAADQAAGVRAQAACGTAADAGRGRFRGGAGRHAARGPDRQCGERRQHPRHRRVGGVGQAEPQVHRCPGPEVQLQPAPVVFAALGDRHGARELRRADRTRRDRAFRMARLLGRQLPRRTVGADRGRREAAVRRQADRPGSAEPVAAHRDHLRPGRHRQRQVDAALRAGRRRADPARTAVRSEVHASSTGPASSPTRPSRPCSTWTT